MKPLRTLRGIHYAVMSSAGDGEQFYCKLGRFFCSKAITEEMGGYQIVDDSSRLWVVAFDKDAKHQAVGFCSFSTRKADKKVIEYCDSFVDQAFRKRGVYRQMFELREFEAVLQLPDGGRLKGVALAISEPIFIEHGYRKASQRGRFAYYEKEVPATSEVVS